MQISGWVRALAFRLFGGDKRLRTWVDLLVASPGSMVDIVELSQGASVAWQA